MTKIAFLGIGMMGLPMASHLAAAGHDVTVWNRNRAKAEAVVGATIADTAAQAVDGADGLQHGEQIRPPADRAGRHRPVRP